MALYVGDEAFADLPAFTEGKALVDAGVLSDFIAVAVVDPAREDDVLAASADDVVYGVDGAIARLAGLAARAAWLREHRITTSVSLRA